MVGPVCRHRLEPPKHRPPAHRVNAIQNEILADYKRQELGYWNIRATQSDYIGEPGELSINGAPAVIALYTDGLRAPVLQEGAR
jgi:hypothetical protein